MVSLTNTNTLTKFQVPRTALWPAALVLLGALVVILSAAIKSNPFPSQDLAVMDWVSGWSLPGLGQAFSIVSSLTSSGAGAIYGAVGVAVLLALRKFRTAVYFSLVGAVVALVAVLGDSTLGEWVGRTRPTGDNPVPSFPSGHVFGSSVFFGFAGFLPSTTGFVRGTWCPCWWSSEP